MRAFTRLSLARQFLLASLLILAAGMIVIGIWVGRQIETGVMNRTAAVTALYVNSVVAPRLHGFALTGRLEENDRAALAALLNSTPLGRRIVAFKVWDDDGRILFSTNPALVDRTFPVERDLASAFAGEVNSKISNLTDLDNAFEQADWSRLIETYAPVRAEGSGSVIAVSEFYQEPGDLLGEVRVAQLRSWIVVGLATLATYLLLAGLVGRASLTISSQRRELRAKVAQLTSLLAQNAQLHRRVRAAATRTIILNERFRQRISADLHDGPGQDLALALLRLEALAETEEVKSSADYSTLSTALNSALDDLRTITAGLRLPAIEQLSLADAARRAVREYQRKTTLPVDLTMEEVPDEVPTEVRITTYRILQEALANSFRHAGGIGQRVRIGRLDDRLSIEIADGGEGFDSHAEIPESHLGLEGMRERVEILGGSFEVRSGPGLGTVIHAILPLTEPGGPRE